MIGVALPGQGQGQAPQLRSLCGRPNESGVIESRLVELVGSMVTVGGVGGGRARERRGCKGVYNGRKGQ